ncbi:MAG: serine acetyltransferase [Cyanobacteria bacterium J06641_5]
MSGTQITKSTEISATEPDWERERLEGWWDPSRQLIRSIRRYQKWRARGGILGSLLCRISTLQHHFWSVVTSSDIPIRSNIGGGLILQHPNGVIVHPDAKIGPNCMLFQQVTIVNGVEIGGHVDVGAGAKLLRGVKIGDHARIGANAVVLCDVPPGATAVGIPARVLPPKSSRQDRELIPEDSQDTAPEAAISA